MNATMFGANRRSTGRTIDIQWAPWLVGLFAALCPLTSDLCPSLAADDGKPPVDGLFITVAHPLRSDGFNHIKYLTEWLRNQRKGWELKIVYDFNPDDAPRNPVDGAGDYGTCRDLARYLLDLQDVTTIAFVHNEVTGHNILPVLACREIVMSKKAKLGNGLGKLAKSLEDDEKVFYERIIRERSYVPAIVLKMIDKNMDVLEGTKAGSAYYIDKSLEAQETQKGFVPKFNGPVLPKGTTAIYDSVQAFNFGLCKVQLESRLEVKEAYSLPARSLREPLQGTPNAWLIKVTGQVDKALYEKLEPKVKSVIRNNGANLIILQLECDGGETEVAYRLAEFFRNLKDDNGENSVMTVAYVTKGARNTATSIALGCTQIVMDKDAVLGAYERILQTPEKYEKYADHVRIPLEELAEKQGYPPLLIRGMLDKKINIHQVALKNKAFERRLMDSDELALDQKKASPKWTPLRKLKESGQLLSLTSRQAKELDLVVDIFAGNPGEANEWLKGIYGLEKIHDTPSGWRETLANYLCSPVLSYFLVILGITGLILEMKIPGFGLPGVVAAICFVLYFWAHSQMHHNLTMLAVLLFILGVILIIIEVFLVPGLGITGVSGVILIIVSLGLVTLVKKPETTYEWVEFGKTLTILSLSLMGSVAGALTVAHYLHNIPWANRLVLTPPGDRLEVLEEEANRFESNAALLGAIGEAATVLRPAGKARFGDQYLDVIAEGSYVPAGARLQVIEIEGNRIVVKEV